MRFALKWRIRSYEGFLTRRPCNVPVSVRIRATRQMCDDLKGQSSSVQQTLTRAETEQEEVEAVHSSLKAELKTFAVTFSELNLKSQNDKNIALCKVEAAVEEMERARWDFVNKLTIKESQAKEMSELLELKNEELKMASQKLQDSIESCARLEETERNFQARLEQMQKESGTLKLEVNRRREIESTLQAGMQNAERSFAEKEREFTASTAGQRLSCDKLQHERRDLNVIVQNLEKANEELTAAASQRRSEEAEIRSRLERNIREKNTEIGNLKIASDNNDMKHRETLVSTFQCRLSQYQPEERTTFNVAIVVHKFISQVKPNEPKKLFVNGGSANHSI
ncbi:uncharacterized protein LOC142922479 isoform X1 [Petromyzon marinus]|uniref:uncharacterized protein LOC142922479 isoform X1 n=1 Tax=Petromyzon marinus TaxID=7757 RepID=UPI003F708319